MARAVCEGCGRPQRVCLCSHMPRLSLPFELVIWQDPTEAKHPLSTAPLLNRMAQGSRLMVGDTFSFEDLFASSDLSDIALLYPSDQHPPLAISEARQTVRKVLVLDGTWRKVRRLLLLNPWLESLPRLALNPESPSLYLRKSPRTDGLSTLEATLVLASDWQQDGSYLNGVEVLQRMAELQKSASEGH